MKLKSLLGVLLSSASLFACAHTPANAPSRVIITASDGAVGRFDTAALERITKAEIARRGIPSRQLTLTASFDSSGFVERMMLPINPTTRGNPTVVSPELISDLSATPWEDGLIVQHGDRVNVGSRSNQNWRREVAVGTYTISDDTGNVLEQRPVVVGVLDPDVTFMILQLQSMHTTGHYLASRVAALSK